MPERNPWPRPHPASTHGGGEGGRYAGTTSQPESARRKIGNLCYVTVKFQKKLDGTVFFYWRSFHELN